MKANISWSEAMAELKAIVGPKGWLSDDQSVAQYVNGIHGICHGRTHLVLRPAKTDEVSKIMRLCFRCNIQVVPQGGNTGYAGGAIPDASGRQVVIALDRMNVIRGIDVNNHTLTVEAGCVLAHVQRAAQEKGLLFPLSLGAEGSCQIGGNLSTNAGGTAVLRYGSCRDLTLGLEVVLPDGRIWNGMSRLRKDNTGYDFRHLFIGAEGTLGIITAAVFRLFPRPESTAAAMVALPSLKEAVALLTHMRRYTGDLVTGFEYIGGDTLALVNKHLSDSPVPLVGYNHIVLIELAGGTSHTDLENVLEQALASAFEEGFVDDAVLASSLAQQNEFWQIRERIPEALAREGTCIPCDVSVPISAIPSFILAASKAVADYCPGVRVLPFGHVGDGNIHFDLLEPIGTGRKSFMDGLPELTETVYDVVHNFEGSFSAEHGIGQLKVSAMSRYRSEVELDMLRATKNVLDPKGLMNPGKVIPNGGSHNFV